MKRIWIAGSSGSGKTTLANYMSKKLGIPAYHRDSITWDENDDERSEEEQISVVKAITVNDKWIFEGARFNASKIDGRLDKCDTIIHLNLNRFLCTYRGIKRGYLQAKRFDLADKDRQPFSINLITYTLLDYPRKRKQRNEIFEIARRRGIDVIILKNRRSVKMFCDKI